MLLFTAKNFAIFFALATTAFCVSTIVLAVQKADLEYELQDALDKLDLISSTETTPTIPVPNPTTKSTENPVDPPDTTTSTTSTTGISPSSPPSSEVITTDVPATPDYPPLPTGLPDPEEILYRLPTDLRPIKYRLYWKPNWDTKTCDGDVSIQIEVDKETNLIVMHAKDLEIEAISILNVMARMRIRVKTFYLAPERELLIIELDELLHMSTPYMVSISFECRLDGLTGMYASVYYDENNNER